MSQWAALFGAALTLGAAERPRPLLFNLDASEFFVGSFGPVEPATIDRYVAGLGATSVSDLFVCVNMQRTNYRSRVWESDWDGYNPAAGDDQPFFAGIAPTRAFEREWYRNSYQWSLKGVDYPQRVLSAAGSNGIRGWISVRMNDAHYPDRPLHPYHSTFWREHPKARLSQSSLDYFHADVRSHYLALIREVAERYDMHGLELDFMRHGHYFHPEQALEGAALMTELVREARRITKEAARRLAHPVKLAVRVPGSPWIATQRGLDAVEWSREGLVDLVVASPWWASSQSDISVESWRGLVRGYGVDVAVALEDGVSSGASGRRTLHVEEARGIALSSLHRGADAVYLFNWFTGPLVEWDKAIYKDFLSTASNQDALRSRARRFPVTLIDPFAAGEPGTPRPLAQTGPKRALRVPVGPLPLAGQRAFVALSLDAGNTPAEVRLNGRKCTPAGEEKDLLLFEVPPGALRPDHALVEMNVPEKAVLTWLEVRIVPPAPSQSAARLHLDVPGYEVRNGSGAYTGFNSVNLQEIYVTRKLPVVRSQIARGWGKPVVVRLSTGKLLASQYKNLRGNPNPNYPSASEEAAIAESNDNGETWSTPRLLGIPGRATQFTALRGDVLILAAGDRLYRSTDRGQTWVNAPLTWKPESPDGKARPLHFDESNGVVELPDGSLACGAFMEVAPGQPRSYFVRSFDGGRTWSQGSYVMVASEISYVVTSSGTLLGIARTPGNGAGEGGASLRTVRSFDAGKTWSEGEQFGLGAAQVPGFPLSLPDGRLLLVYGNRQFPFGAQAILSHDEGRTWSVEEPLVLSWFSWDAYCGHPRSLILPSGEILTGYYTRVFKEQGPNEDVVSHVVRWAIPGGWPTAHASAKAR